MGQEAGVEGIQSRKGGRMGRKFMSKASSWAWAAIAEWRWKQSEWRRSWSWEASRWSGSFLVPVPVAQGEDLCVSVQPPFFGDPCVSVELTLIRDGYVSQRPLARALHLPATVIGSELSM